jgi:hypothetical protein
MAHRTGPAALTCFPVPSSDPLTSRPGLDRCAHAVNLTGTLGGHAVPRARARVCGVPRTSAESERELRRACMVLCTYICGGVCTWELETNDNGKSVSVSRSRGNSKKKNSSTMQSPRTQAIQVHVRLQPARTPCAWPLAMRRADRLRLWVDPNRDPSWNSCCCFFFFLSFFCLFDLFFALLISQP